MPLRTLLVGLFCLAAAVPATPAFAAGGTDVTVTIVHDPAVLKAAKRVSYRITVHNLGPQAAAKVSIDFVTSAALTSPAWTVSTGRCLRSPAETACLFGTLRSGGSAWATISGVLPASLPPGTQVKNTVTVASDTTLINPAHSVANADYTVPGGSPSPAPSGSSGPGSSGPGSAPAVAQDRPAPAGTSRLWTVAAAGAGAAVLALVVWLVARRRAVRH